MSIINLTENNKWLTTGEMLDRLKFGEIAESPRKRYLTKSGDKTHYTIYPCTESGEIIEEVPLYLNKSLLTDKWRIIDKKN